MTNAYLSFLAEDNRRKVERFLDDPMASALTSALKEEMRQYANLLKELGEQQSAASSERADDQINEFIGRAISISSRMPERAATWLTEILNNHNVIKSFLS